MDRFVPVDLDEHHRRVATRAAAGDDLARAAAADVAGQPPLTLRLTDGRAWSYVPGPERPSERGTGPDAVAVVPGERDGATVALLDDDAWHQFVHELRTSYGLLYAGLVRLVTGGFDTFAHWEPALRALWHDRPIYDPASVATFADVDGSPLDLACRFPTGTDDARLAHVLQQTGYLHVQGVFSPDEMATLRAEVERLTAEARPGDGTSWWAKDADGHEVCCRLIYTGPRSPAIAALSQDPRVLRLGALAGVPLRPSDDRLDGHSVVMKQPGAVEGLADLPWHRDCGLGGHPVLCPGINLGIQLDAATPETGQLHVLPGSWAHSSHQVTPGAEATLPVVALTTEPGDCTVHLGHVLHAAPSPTGTGGGRRALYVTFVPDVAFEVVGQWQGYNDVIHARDGVVSTSSSRAN
jgi:ectoine hydroxylase-related dioxygenase (phytanoyl-CoA dioxygenase family)